MLARGRGQSCEHVNLIDGGVWQLGVDDVYAAVVLKRLNRVQVVLSWLEFCMARCFAL